MDFKELLTQNRKAIVDGWIEVTLNTYPPETFKFFSKESDRFRNPVGYNIADGLRNLFDELMGNMDSEKIMKELDKIIRIRSVQEFKASEAIAFVFLLKDVIREKMSQVLENDRFLKELLNFERQIDRLALDAFDNYNECRENLNEIKLKQARAGSVKIIEKLNKRLEAKPKAGS